MINWAISTIDFLNLRTRSFLLYLLIGGSGTALGFILLFVGVQYLKMEKNLTFFLQNILVLQLTFLMYYFVAWKDRARLYGYQTFSRRWVKFHLARITVLIMSQASFAAMTIFINYLVANLIVNLLAAGITFLVNDRVVFVHDK
jgi:putative flippase GtrA